MKVVNADLSFQKCKLLGCCASSYHILGGGQVNERACLTSPVPFSLEFMTKYNRAQSGRCTYRGSWLGNTEVCVADKLVPSRFRNCGAGSGSQALATTNQQKYRIREKKQNQGLAEVNVW